MLAYENRIRTVKRITVTVNNNASILFTCDYPYVTSQRPDEFMIEDQLVVNGLVETMSGMDALPQQDVEGIIRYTLDNAAVMIQHLDNEGPAAEFIPNAALELAISPDVRTALVQIIRPERGSTRTTSWYSR